MKRKPGLAKDHVIDLAGRLKVYITRDRRKSVGASYASSLSRYVLIGGGTWTDTDYAIALHELGHCYHKHVRFTSTTLDEKLAQEVQAWDWAKSVALWWSPEMEACRQIAYGTYEKGKQQTS